jgi:hypothetical protein
MLHYLLIVSIPMSYYPAMFKTQYSILGSISLFRLISEACAMGYQDLPILPVISQDSNEMQALDLSAASVSSYSRRYYISCTITTSVSESCGGARWVFFFSSIINFCRNTYGHIGFSVLKLSSFPWGRSFSLVAIRPNFHGRGLLAGDKQCTFVCFLHFPTHRSRSKNQLITC